MNNIQTEHYKTLKELKELVKSIPKEYQKTLRRIILIERREAIYNVYNLIDNITQINPDKIESYGVYHENDIDGG